MILPVFHSVTIITYHAIEPTPGPYALTPAALEHQLSFIKDRFRVMRLRELPRLLSEPASRERRIVFTFDDAYENFVKIAFPLLQKLKLPCSLFVPTRYLGGLNEWDLETPGVPERKLMTADEVKSVFDSRLVDIGSHSVDHVRMNTLSMAEMRRQATDSKYNLEKILGSPVRTFAYPFGAFSDQTERVLREAGYEIAVTSRHGTRNAKENLMALYRVALTESDRNGRLQRKIEEPPGVIAIKQKFRNWGRSLRRRWEATQ